MPTASSVPGSASSPKSAQVAIEAVPHLVASVTVSLLPGSLVVTCQLSVLLMRPVVNGDTSSVGLRITTGDGLELDSLRSRLVRPFYMAFLHGNVRRRSAGELCRIREDLRGPIAASDSELVRLLEEPEWRGRLTAAWLVALTKRRHFVDRLGPLLLASEMCFAGQGYCVALGIIGGASAEGYLREYLHAYLPPNGRHYDQDWAIGALAHIAPIRYAEFLDPRLWGDPNDNLEPKEGIEDFAELIQFLSEERLTLP